MTEKHFSSAFSILQEAGVCTELAKRKLAQLYDKYNIRVIITLICVRRIHIMIYYILLSTSKLIITRAPIAELIDNRLVEYCVT